MTSLVRNYLKLCIVTFLMKVWKIVQRAVIDRAVAPSVKPFLWEEAQGVSSWMELKRYSGWC